MSFFRTSAYSSGPMIRRVGNQLHASTGMTVLVLSLGLWYRKVIVDPDKKRLRIHDRALWIFRSRRSYKFSHIRAIAYGYSDQSGGSTFQLAHDTYDVFSVGIKLHGDDNTYRHLFRFFGEGSFVNNSHLPNWWYWDDYFLDRQGDQERESRRFVELLHKMIEGTTIEPV